MAKSKTPEEIQAMEDEVRQYRAKEAEEQTKVMREKAQGLIDFVGGEPFAQLEAAVPDLETLAADGEAFPFLRDHVAAVRNGLRGLRQTVDMLPQLPVAEPIAPEG